MQATRRHPTRCFALMWLICLMPLVSLQAYISDCSKPIIMPEIKIKEATLEEVIQYLRVKTADVAGIGVNFIIQGASAEQKDKKITLELRNVPLKDVVETIAKMTGMKMRIDSFAVVLLPLDAPNQMHTRIYRVPPDFLQAVGR